MEEMQDTHEIGRKDVGGTPRKGEDKKATSDAPMRSEIEGDKRVRFDALQAVVVSSSDVNNMVRGTRFKQRVLDWVEQMGILGEYKNGDTGWGIVFNRRSVRNVLGHDAGDGKVALLEYAPDLIENGVFLETTAKKDGLKSHIFAAKATIDGKNYTVGFVVREDSNGKRYYDHAISIDVGNKKLAASSLRGLAPAEAETHTDAKLPEDDNTISGIVRKHVSKVKDSGGQVSDGEEFPEQTSETSLPDAPRVVSTHNIPQFPKKINT